MAKDLVPATRDGPGGTGGVRDASSFAKKGSAGVGLKRPGCGRLGQKANGPVGVFLGGGTPAGTALLDHPLYRPREGAGDRPRRRPRRVPQGRRFQTKPPIARALGQRTGAAGPVRFDWLTVDEGSGRHGAFRTPWAAAGQRSRAEGPVRTSVGPADPRPPRRPCAGVGPPPPPAPRRAGRSVPAVAAAGPAAAWQTLQVRDGAAGPLVVAFAGVRLWARRDPKPGAPLGLLVRRALAAEPEVQSSLSTAAEGTPLAALAGVSRGRFRVEEFFEEGKSSLGMADSEGRSRTRWPHPVPMVALAHRLVTPTRVRLQKNARADVGPSAAGPESGPAAAGVACRGRPCDHRLAPEAQPHCQAVAP